MNNVNQGSTEVFTRKWLLIVTFCVVPLFFLFAFFGDPGRGRAAVISAGVLMTAVRATWSCKKYAWFWAIAVVLIALHAFLILDIPWTDKSYPGYTLLPFAALDYGIVYGCFKLAEKLMTKTDTSST
jgi:hypothetical protein